MKNKFPKMVYAHPGLTKIDGEGYATQIVHSEEELVSALKGGFYESAPEALKNTRKPAPKPTANNQALAAEVGALQKQLDEGIAKLNAEREALAAERAKVEAEAASTALAIENLQKDLEALAAEQKAVKEARESLDADRAAFEAQKAASNKSAGKK